MGGGDLNTKKSWHPNTMKNQERVWKAEQAAAEEKKRILELQREREVERNRAQLKDMAQRNFGGPNSDAGDNRLHWMYDKPDKQANQEDYLLGKAIGKNDDDQAQNTIPAVSRRVVGSSMTTTADDAQVDLARKLREDPLLLVKERERAARAALLNNPLQRKKLTELLRKEQEQREHKMSKSKKKNKKKGKDLDDALTAKLNELAGNKGIDLTSLLNSDDSSDSSSDDNKSKKKKKKEKHKKKSKKKPSSDSNIESSDDDVSYKKSKKSSKKKDKTSKSDKDKKRESRKRHSDDSGESNNEVSRKKRRQSESESSRMKEESNEPKDQFRPDADRRNRKASIVSNKPVSDNRDRNYRGSRQQESVERHRSRRDISPRLSPKRENSRRESPKRKFEDRRDRRQGLSEDEKAARLAEMAAAGAEREVERGERVARQRAADGAAETRAPRHARHEARALPDSLESRIRSNRHYIQRDRLHMNEHFARR